MKKNVVKIIAVVLVALAAAGIIARVNSASLAMALGGYGDDTVIIEEGFSYVDGSTTRWRAFLAEKDGISRLAIMEQGFLGFWKLSQAASDMSGEYEGLEYIGVDTQPPCGFDYGYDPYAIADTMTHTDNWKFATIPVSRTHRFYHGSNAAQTITIPEDSLPRDCTVQIYQNKEEYVLHLCQYCKGDGPFEVGFEDIYQALGGSLKTE